jgi:bacteriorhodopsin
MGEFMEAAMVFKDSDLNQLVYNALSFGTAVMLGAFVYFLTQIKSVAKQFQSGVAVSAVVVGIACYHYFRMWSDWGAGKVNEGYRYADWLITVPLLVIELLIVLGVTRDRRKKLMTTLVPATVLMIALGYPGETAADDGTKWLFWVLSMLPFLYILYTLNGELKAAGSRETGEVSSAITDAPGSARTSTAAAPGLSHTVPTSVQPARSAAWLVRMVAGPEAVATPCGACGQ